MDLLQTHNLNCPYCGEEIQLIIDCSILEQKYIEDCQVCCQPINIFISIENDTVQIHIASENE
ncbi:MAG: CPXCG motif-containing cysteine-rich protein [Gammaproteobacteria bacterium]|nr:CPXCG motif-containing cysteine-rich protein [Gammaproteobacteria bacterium]